MAAQTSRRSRVARAFWRTCAAAFLKIGWLSPLRRFRGPITRAIWRPVDPRDLGDINGWVELGRLTPKQVANLRRWWESPP